MNKSDISGLVAKVESYCLDHGARFTEPRKYVLEIIAAAEKPVGAYDILAELGKKIPNPKPPTAYRAVEFLVENGFVHRIESLNAYVLCHTDHRHNGSQFMICDSCGRVEETHLCGLPSGLEEKADAAGFAVKRWNAELHGSCAACKPGRD